jgi:hypothetical protein
MVREIMSASVQQQVSEKYDGKCYVCGFSIHIALRVHHVVPASLGGTDEIENLVLLCPNCHALVHVLSSKRFIDKDLSGLLAPEYDEAAIGRMVKLSQEIIFARQRIRQNGNIWNEKNPNSHRPYTLEEAITSVAQQNKYSDRKRKQSQEALFLALSHIPRELRTRCSYRLLKRGSYVSINLMNYLLYRSPGYGDLGGKPTYDCFLIFTSRLRDRFFDCVNLGLSFSEVSMLSRTDWEDFANACQMAARARKSRNWVSNIKISEGE